MTFGRTQYVTFQTVFLSLTFDDACMTPVIDARDVPLGRVLGPKMEVREVLGVAVVEEAADRELRAAPPVEEIELGLGVVGLVGDFVGDFGRLHQYMDEISWHAL